MTRYPNRGKPPRDKSVKLGIEWANGRESPHQYTAGQLIWDRRGWDFDIGFFWKAAV